MLRIFTRLTRCTSNTGELLHLVVWSILGVLGGVGCGFDKSVLAADEPKPAPSDPPAQTRMQNADPAPKKTAASNILDLASYEATPQSQSQVAARICATVNGVAILQEEVLRVVLPNIVAANALPDPERTARKREIYKQAREALVERELLLQDLAERAKDRPMLMDKLKEDAEKEFEKQIRDRKKRMGVKDDEEFKAIIRAQGWTYEGLHRHLNREFTRDRYMQMLIYSTIDRIDHEQIQEYYDTHPEEFRVQDSVTWQDIFIDAGRYPNRDAARQFASQLAANARAGEDFVQLVKKFDQGDSSYRNGEGFGHRKGEIKPADAEPILFQMRDGEVAPVLEQANGFHVIRLVSREYAGLKPFDAKTQTLVRNKLQMEVFNKESKRIIAALKRKASIQVSESSPW
jgi:parvulin-like peptidyl-prolyl isomerase